MPIYAPTNGPADWQALLADPDKHWRTGFSARSLAYAWESAKGLPPEIERFFGMGTSLLIGIPEHKVDLPGGTRPSQTDLFALLRCDSKTIACAVEGKVDEAFGPSLAEWLENASEGKVRRLTFICELLGLRLPLPPATRYQLLHRAASAVIEAQKFKTDEAAMIVHSFSQKGSWFHDYEFFMQLFGKQVVKECPAEIQLPMGMVMQLGWVQGDLKFLSF